MSTGPDDQINVDRDYEDRGSAWRWLLPLLAIAIVIALLWAMFGDQGATYPTTSGSGTTISTPASGVGGAGSSGAGATGSSGMSTGTSGGTTTRP